MNNRKWRRLLCGALALCLIFGALLSVNALFFVGDVNGDGRISAFDAQLLAEAKAGLRELTESQTVTADNTTLQDILRYVFGNTAVDSGDMDADGVIELYTADSLQLLRDKPGGSYRLMADLDLQGADWAPVIGFSGTLDGNGHTVSNFTITQSVADTRTADSYNMGFFGDTQTTAVIRDLHLKDVTLQAAENATFLGFFAGTLRGQLTGCTVTGQLQDTRQTYAQNVHVGVMAGRLASGSGGSITGGTCLSVTDEAGVATTEGLCANVKLFIENKDINKVAPVPGKVGLSGYVPTGYTVTGQWTDTTCSSDRLSQTLQNRQRKVTDYMTAMASVQWTPSEELVYTANNGTDQTYTPGTVYTGLPYNGHNSSMERFLSVMAAQDENGVYTTATGLGSNCGYLPTGETDENGNPISDWTDHGFYLTMGNDCSAAVGWAWMQVSNVVVSDTASHNTPYKGGAFVSTTRYMVPNHTNRTAKGIYPVGNWTASTTDANGKWVSAEFDAAKAAYQCTDEVYTPDVLKNNSLDTIWEAYAQTRKADGIVCFVSKWSTRVNEGGHARLVVADPVVIRTAEGAIDPNASYLLLTEQGVNFGKTSTWNICKPISFYALTGNVAELEDVTTATKTYLPITIRALREEKIRDVYLVNNSKNPITSPVTGSVYSYHRINSVTVTVTDQTGQVFYDRQAFTGIGLASSVYRARSNEALLAELHGDAFYAAAALTGMEPEQTYLFSVDVLLSTGDSYDLITDQPFVYTPAA